MSSSSEPVLIQGRLSKRGKSVAGIGLWWKTRFFRLTASYLTYTDLKQQTLLASISTSDIAQCVNVKTRRTRGRRFMIRLVDHTVLQLCAMSVGECIQWVSVLCGVIAVCEKQRVEERDRRPDGISSLSSNSVILQSPRAPIERSQTVSIIPSLTGAAANSISSTSTSLGSIGYLQPNNSTSNLHALPYTPHSVPLLNEQKSMSIIGGMPIGEIALQRSLSSPDHAELQRMSSREMQLRQQQPQQQGTQLEQPQSQQLYQQQLQMQQQQQQQPILRQAVSSDSSTLSSGSPTPPLPEHLDYSDSQSRPTKALDTARHQVLDEEWYDEWDTETEAEDQQQPQRQQLPKASSSSSYNRAIYLPSGDTRRPYYSRYDYDDLPYYYYVNRRRRRQTASSLSSRSPLPLYQIYGFTAMVVVCSFIILYTGHTYSTINEVHSLYDHYLVSPRSPIPRYHQHWLVLLVKSWPVCVLIITAFYIMNSIRSFILLNNKKSGQPNKRRQGVSDTDFDWFGGVIAVSIASLSLSYMAQHQNWLFE